MISELPLDSPTERHWTFNDEKGQNYMLYIPADQPVITATLKWKETSDSEPCLVGKYWLDLRALEANGYVRLKDNRFFLRFQRTREKIEIAINGSSKAMDLGGEPIWPSTWILDGGPGEP